MKTKNFAIALTIYLLLLLLSGFAFGEASTKIDGNSGSTIATSVTAPTSPSQQPQYGISAGAKATIEPPIMIPPEKISPPTGSPLERSPENSPRISMVCGGNEAGYDCKSFDEIEISEDGIYAQTAAPASSETQQIFFPEDTGDIPEEIKYRVIDKNLLYASSQALSSNPEFVFHVKIYLEGEGISWEKIIPMFENEIGITIRKTDKEANIIYADAEAGKIRSITTNGAVSLIGFDSAFPLPSFPKQEVVKKQKIQESSIKATVVINEKNEELIVSKKEKTKGVVIESKGYIVETSEKVKIDSNGLSIAGRQINVLPNSAAQKVETENNAKAEAIELKLIEEKPVYEINAVKKAKLFWIIPVEISITATVNAQTGEVEKIEKPWWSFLVG